MITWRMGDTLVRHDGETIGYVRKVTVPYSAEVVRTETRFEARRPHEALINAEVGTFPTFKTKLEAAEYLASGVAETLTVIRHPQTV